MGQAPTNLINAGIYVLETSVLDRIPAGRRVSIERETFPELVGAGALYALASDAYWLDTGTPQQFLQAQIDILAGRRLAAPGAPQLRAGIWCEPGAEVAGELCPLCYVGAEAEVAEGSLVRDAVIGRGCQVGPGAKVSGSVLMTGARVRAGAQICDSIVGPRAVIAEGARLSAISIIGVGAKVTAGSVLEGACYPLS